MIEAFTWLQQSTAIDSTGQAVESWSDNGTVIGFRVAIRGWEALKWALLSLEDIKLEFNERVEFSCKDRLQDSLGKVWEITGVSFEYRKTIVTCRSA